MGVWVRVKTGCDVETIEEAKVAADWLEEQARADDRLLFIDAIKVECDPAGWCAAEVSYMADRDWELDGKQHEAAK